MELGATNLDTPGRVVAERKDSQATRRKLVEGIGSFVATHGYAPTKLAEVAQHSGVSTATAYRYFASIDDLANAHLLKLPQDAASRFARSRVDRTDADALLHAWNRSWVAACLHHGGTAIPLRSPRGFLSRLRTGDSAVTYVSDRVLPLLEAVGGEAEVGLAVWNVVSDPREVVDFRSTLGWSPERIVKHITRLTYAALGK